MDRFTAALCLLAASCICAAAQAPLNTPKPDLSKPNVYRSANSYTAAYHYLTCATSVQEEPASTAEVAAFIKKQAVTASAGTPVTLRTSRPRFHSTASFVCPAAPATTAAGTANPAVAAEAGRKGGPVEVGLLSSKLNKVLAVDAAKHTLRVGAGMTIDELLKAATKNKMSVQIGSLPAYAGLTLGGVLATSAHGSGDRTVSSLGDTVLEVTWVDGAGKVHVSKRGDPEFGAFNGGLGVFGVMTELLIQLTPPSNTQLITVVKKDTNMMAEIDALLKIAPHILVHWRPDAGEFKAFLTRPAPAGAKVTADSKIQASMLPNTTGNLKLASAFNTWHVVTDDDSDMMEMFCPQVTENSLGTAWVSVGSGADAKKLDNVTAATNQMISAECDESCLWNDREVLGGTAMDAEFTIDYSSLAGWIGDVKKIFNEELKEGGKKKFRCMGFGYMWIRFGRDDADGVTATPSGIARPVYVQSTWMRSRLQPHFNMRYQFVVDLVEEITLCKYKGRPHWGKNFDRTFLHPKCPVAPLYPKFGSLVALAKQHDPKGLFKPRLFDQMAAKGRYQLFPQCASLMKCFCSEDIHCRPGDKCVPSRAFPEYKVCKNEMKDVPGKLVAAMMGA